LPSNEPYASIKSVMENKSDNKGTLPSLKACAIVETLKANKGRNLSAVWNKTLKTRKGVFSVITKNTSLVIRGGIDYDNMRATREGREDGTLPQENAGLPWGEWAIFPFVITHKGNEYIRLYPASMDLPIKTQYFIDGKAADKEACQTLCLASEFSKGEKPLCFTVKLENIRSID